MPYSITHLEAVSRLLNETSLASDYPWLLEPDAFSACLLGAIAPDARVVSGQPRESTHFYDIPYASTRAPHDLMLSAYPALQASIDYTKSAFVAGYICHLIMDIVWLDRIVMPYLYIEDVVWGNSHPHWPLYCLLLAHIEKEASATLPTSIGEQLAASHPGQWLPFLANEHLMTWRDRIAGAIQNGAIQHIARYQAELLNIDPNEVHAILSSQERLAEVANQVVPLSLIPDFHQETARQSEQTIRTYLEGNSLV